MSDHTQLDDASDEGYGADASFKHLAHLLRAGDRTDTVIYAPHGNINTGSVQGDQCVLNGHAAHHDDRRAPVHDGPISAAELAKSQWGFAEPDWFPSVLSSPGTRVLFLTGQPGTGRRTAAVNLLLRRSRPGTTLWAVDGDTDLSSWRPGPVPAGATYWTTGRPSTP